MFTAAIILMEMKRPRGQRRCIHGIARNLRIPGEHYDYKSTNGHAQIKKTSSKIPSEHFFESLHNMHDNDQSGLVLVNRPPPEVKSMSTNTTSSTTAVVNPVPIRVTKKQATPKDDLADEKEVDEEFVTASEIPIFGPPGDVEIDFKPLFNEIKRFPEELGEDGDRIATLRDEITMKKEKRRMVMDQILKLEEQKRRFIRNTALNLRKFRDCRKKREQLELDTQAKVDRRWQQVIDLQKEKITMEEKLEKFEDIGLNLAMQKEEKHRRLLQIIDNAPALYRKESENLEERQQRENVRYQVVMGVFLALFALLLITYISRFGVTEKSPTHSGLFY